jgi:hypothetical protein
MPTENKPTETFQREDRYIVIKRSDVDNFWRDDVREQFMAALELLNEHHLRIPQRQYVVIESDWPEYEPAWQMIERRVTGTPGEGPEVVAVIDEEGEHFKATVVEHRPGIDRLPVGTELVDRAHVIRLQAECDALQTRLNAADQRIDELTAPAGYCLMPTRLTAENGAKALLLGEFKLEVTTECPECRELEEPLEGCEVCDGEGEYGQQHMIPWDQIKFIYSEAVKGLAKNPNTPR